MGLFGFSKKKKVIIPEADEEKVDWFFSEDGERTFQSRLHNVDHMMDVLSEESGLGLMLGLTQAEGGMFRNEHLPCTFIADYLRAYKTIDVPKLTCAIVDLAIDGNACEGIPYPNCLTAAFNPLINFAIKFKPIYHSKNGKDIKFNSGLNTLIDYLHDVYALYLEDESNESWIYEETLWFNKKGKEREWQEIVTDIKENVKHKDLIKVAYF